VISDFWTHLGVSDRFLDENRELGTLVIDAGPMPGPRHDDDRSVDLDLFACLG
jgi:hypothetical protein